MQVTDERVDVKTTCPQCGLQETQNSPPRVFCSQCRFPLLVLQQRYQIQEKLAQGGCGAVYLALDKATNEQVVVKVIKPEMLENKDMIVRFRREIRITRHLASQNEHVVKIFEHGEELGLGHYYVMEYLQGQSLAEYLGKHPQRTFGEVLRIFQQFCEAIQEAHANGIIHRDIKPDNVFLIERDGDPLFVKVLDFGIAKPLEGTMNQGLTVNALGTPHYMAPEQCVNQAVDARSDIYSMGIMLYEMLTGTLPFQFAGDAVLSIVFAHMTVPPEPLRQRRKDLPISEKLEGVILKALEKRPDQRHSSVKAFWDAIDSCYIEEEQFITPIPAQLQQRLQTNAPLLPSGDLLGQSIALAATGILHQTGGSLEQLQQFAPQANALPQTSPGIEMLPSSPSDPLATAIEGKPTANLKRAAHVPQATARMDLAHATDVDADPTELSLRLPPGFEAAASKRAIMPWALGSVIVVLLGVVGVLFWQQTTQKTPADASPARNVVPAHRTEPIRNTVSSRQVPTPRTTPSAPAFQRATSPSQTSGSNHPTAPRPRLLAATVLPAPVRRVMAHVERRRLRRRHSKRRMASIPRRVAPVAVGPCGPSPMDGYHWLFGKMQTPGRATPKVVGCKRCVIVRKSGGYCLLLPSTSGQARRIRIQAEGYVTCNHRVDAQMRQVRWTLKGENPDDLSPSTYYKCYEAVK